VSRLALWPNQPPVQWSPGSLFLKVKRQGHEADHSPPSSAKVKKGGSITPHPSMSSRQSAQLIMHRDVTLSVLNLEHIINICNNVK
jgi:hypothetical protein